MFDPEDALALEFGIGVLFCVFTNFFFLIVEPFGFSWWVGTLLECVVNILMQGGVLEILRLKLVRRLDKSKNKCVRAVSCLYRVRMSSCGRYASTWPTDPARNHSLSSLNTLIAGRGNIFSTRLLPKDPIELTARLSPVS